MVSYTTVPPLPVRASTPSAVHFCGTILQLALTGRYPASCPVEPGLSSRGALRAAGDCLSNFPAISKYTVTQERTQLQIVGNLFEAKRLSIDLGDEHLNIQLIRNEITHEHVCYPLLHDLLYVVPRINQRNPVG